MIHPCTHMYANLSKTIKEFDVSYRKGKAKISDQEFDSLIRNFFFIHPDLLPLKL